MSSRSKASSIEGAGKLIVAIDIGTSYSGYAFATRNDLEASSPNVTLNALWKGLDKTVTSFKTPTVLLLNEKREFEAFGYEAEKRYQDLHKEGRHQRCFYFRRFKTKLYGNHNLRSSYALKEEYGKTIAAIKVFTFCIRFLKGHLLNTLRMRGYDVSTEEMKWIMPVPAVFNDVAKQFLREAAVQAGIPSDRLRLALEPEAASVYCQTIASDRLSGKLPITTPGTKYVLCDIGGGLTDIVLHELRQDGKLRELSKGGGNICGGTSVDNAFLQFLVRLLGSTIARDFLDEYKLEFLDVQKEFETEKRTVTPRGGSGVELKIPPCLERVCKRKQNGESLDKVISRSVYREKVTVIDSKLCIDADMGREFYRAVAVEIARQIKLVLTEKIGQDVKFLVLVGGLAESPVVQESIKKELEGKTKIERIIVPPEPTVAMLKGSVIYGNQPRRISSRVIRYTYGLRKAQLYNPDLHPEEVMMSVHGTEYVTEIFSVFITAGTRAPAGFMSYDSLTTIEPFQKVIEIDVYFSTDLRPVFVTDKNCWLLGKVNYPVPNPSKEERTVYIEFIFGDTELVLNVTDRKTHNKCKNTFPLIENK